MKTGKLLLTVCALVFCLLPLFACDEQQDNNQVCTSDVQALHFADNSDINLTLGVEEKECATFDVVNAGDGYCLLYDHNIVSVVGHKIVAVGAGSTTLTIYDNEQSDSLNIMVRVLPFCGEVSLEEFYVFDINGEPKTINPIGLNDNYGYEITYETTDSVFNVDENGLVTPLNCGTGILKMTLVSGVYNGRLQFVTLTTVVNVVDTPTIDVSIFDNKNNPIQCINNKYVLYAMPGGTEYTLKVDYTGGVQNVVSTTSLPNTLFKNAQKSENTIWQPFSVNGKCNFSVQYMVLYNTYNYTTTIYSKMIDVQVFLYILDFDINVRDVVLGGNVAYEANNLNLYLVADTLNAKTDAARNNVFKDVDITIGTSLDTDGLYEVSLSNDLGAVTENNGSYLIRPNMKGTITLTVRAVNGDYFKTLTINVCDVEVYAVDFCEINTNLVVGDELSLIPTIHPSYANVDVSYVYSGDVITICNGVLTAQNVGNVDLTISVKDFAKLYHLTVVNDGALIYASAENLNGYDGLSINYLVGDGINFEQYEQSVALLLYAEDGSVLTVDNVNIFVGYQSRTFDVYVGPSLNYFRAVLYSCQYEIYSQPFVWMRG